MVFDVLFNQSDHAGDASWGVCDVNEPCTDASFPIRFFNERLIGILDPKDFPRPCFRALSNHYRVND